MERCQGSSRAGRTTSGSPPAMLQPQEVSPERGARIAEDPVEVIRQADDATRRPGRSSGLWLVAADQRHARTLVTPGMPRKDVRRWEQMAGRAQRSGLVFGRFRGALAMHGGLIEG